MAAACSVAVAQPKAQPQPPTPARPAVMPGVAPPPVTGQPGAKPTEFGTVEGQQTGEVDPDLLLLPAFAEPVQLSTLVELVAKTLHINITTKGDVPGSVVFNAPVPVKKADLIGLLDALLEQQNWTVIKDRFGFYSVQPLTEVQVNIGAGEGTTTRSSSRRRTSVRPRSSSRSRTSLGSRFRRRRGRGRLRISTRSALSWSRIHPRRVEAFGSLLHKLLEEAAKTTFTRIELSYLSASVARERALLLVGQASTGRAGQVQGQEGQPRRSRGGPVRWTTSAIG